MDSWDELSYEMKLGAPYLFFEGYLMAGTLYISPFDKDMHILNCGTSFSCLIQYP